MKNTERKLEEYVQNCINCMNYIIEGANVMLTNCEKGSKIQNAIQVIDNIYGQGGGAIAFAEHYLGEIDWVTGNRMMDVLTDAYKKAKQRAMEEIK